MMNVSDKIKYVGVDDLDIDLFESQYVVPEGMSYNSYVILDEKTAVMDTVDARKTDEWINNVKVALGGKNLDYIVCLHMEPDHAGSMMKAMETFPTAKVVGNAKTFTYMAQFFDVNLEGRKVEVKDGESLSLGEHNLTFVCAPMVHWPEVMVAYESSEKVLFAADAFGKFGAISKYDGDWACEARRYYFNICGKYGVQVQSLLKKAAALDIKTIAPLHGPVLKENLGYYIDLYNTWSSYGVESEGVLVAFASIHGNTRKAAEKIASILEKQGAKKVVVSDLSRDDEAEVIEDAFRYGRMIVAAPTYDGGLFPTMESFLSHLKSKNYQKRTVGIIENGTWAPMSGKLMKAALESMKEIKICDTVVTIKSALKAEQEDSLVALAKEVLA
ncbi:MAG: flavodoxin domain-containing protein [Paludibacteraceae bacterium]|nr:flavodoxin domain-containing protein [Paludibacteraceae bacterium]